MAILVLKRIIKKNNCGDLKFCRKLGTYKNFTSKINSTLGVNFDLFTGILVVKKNSLKKSKKKGKFYHHCPKTVLAPLSKFFLTSGSMSFAMAQTDGHGG